MAVLYAARALRSHANRARAIHVRDRRQRGGDDAVGSEREAYKIAVYAIAGLLSAVTALLLAARLDSAQPIAGNNYELDAIAAVVIGGSSLLGGSGSVVGTLIGALIMSVLRNGLNLLGVSSYVQQIAIGAVIIVAVLVDMALRRRAPLPRGTAA